MGIESRDLDATTIYTANPALAPLIIPLVTICSTQLSNRPYARSNASTEISEVSFQRITL
jgi:hypothetical protein